MVRQIKMKIPTKLESKNIYLGLAYLITTTCQQDIRQPEGYKYYSRGNQKRGKQGKKANQKQDRGRDRNKANIKAKTVAMFV